MGRGTRKNWEYCGIFAIKNGRETAKYRLKIGDKTATGVFRHYKKAGPLRLTPGPDTGERKNASPVYQGRAPGECPKRPFPACILWAFFTRWTLAVLSHGAGRSNPCRKADSWPYKRFYRQKGTAGPPTRDAAIYGGFYGNGAPRRRGRGGPPGAGLSCE